MSGQDHTGREPVNAPIFVKPPIWALLFMAAGFALNHFVPLVNLPSPFPLESIVVGCFIMACSIAIVALAAREMARSRTAILPGSRAASLVQNGVFKRSRNPMYLSAALFMAGLGIATVNPWMIVLAPVLLLVLQALVVKREETSQRAFWRRLRGI